MCSRSKKFTRRDRAERERIFLQTGMSMLSFEYNKSKEVLDVLSIEIFNLLSFTSLQKRSTMGTNKN
ncbi:hypothetical protein HFA01_18640 [Halobacillus faecis]|uniref:Uncharacterized protein n=1 Tax=Halobacillus faecis TaxID=360184 RepID=A0A511WW50_9BACI|nr:hypothetical protein HFA01_18640 [Halobacillus faecis]